MPTAPTSIDSVTEQLTADQVRADAARDLLLYGSLDSESVLADAVARVRPSVHVTVPVMTLMGESESPGLLDGYGPIDADTARRLAARAPSFTRILTHPVSGAVLDVDRGVTGRRPISRGGSRCATRRAASRAAIALRVDSDIDHTVGWHDDGRTAFDNLAHLCAPHHHLKHETSWSVRQIGGGSLEWTSPTGLRHRTHPANPIPDRPPPF